LLILVEREADDENDGSDAESPTAHLKKLFLIYGIYTTPSLYAPNY